MNWRPKDWIETTKSRITEMAKLRTPGFPILIQEGLEWDLTKIQLFDAGADAMLEALKSEAKYVDTAGKPYGYIHAKILHPCDKGWVVFIPDE